MSKLKVSDFFAAQLNNHALSLFRIGRFMNAEKCWNRALLTATMKETPPDTKDYIHIEQERQEQNVKRNHLFSFLQGPLKSFRFNVWRDVEGMRVYYDPVFIQISSKSEEKTIQKAIIYNLGIGYLWLRQHDEAHAHFSKALSLSSQTEGDTHPSDIMILHNLGYVNFVKGRYSEAFSNYSEALRILQKSKGYYHPDVATCLNSIGVIAMYSFMENSGDGEKVEGFFTEVLAIYSAISSDESSNKHTIDRVKRNIARIKSLRGEVKDLGPIYSLRQAVDKILNGLV